MFGIWDLEIGASAAVQRRGRRAFHAQRSQSASFGGAHGRENVGMSNMNFGEKPRHRKLKVSWAMNITPGLVGPKARPKGVVDG